MKSEDMFRRIGFYTESWTEENELTYESNIMGNIKIVFDLINQTYYVCAMSQFEEDDKCIQGITIAMHKAINKFLEEQGWLND